MQANSPGGASLIDEQIIPTKSQTSLRHTQQAQQVGDENVGSVESCATLKFKQARLIRHRLSLSCS